MSPCIVFQGYFICMITSAFHEGKGRLLLLTALKVCGSGFSGNISSVLACVSKHICHIVSLWHFPPSHLHNVVSLGDPEASEMKLDCLLSSFPSSFIRSLREECRPSRVSWNNSCDGLTGVNAEFASPQNSCQLP